MLDNWVQHTDIKIANIVVSEEGRVYLIDNGDWGFIDLEERRVGTPHKEDNNISNLTLEFWNWNIPRYVHSQTDKLGYENVFKRIYDIKILPIKIDKNGGK